MSNLPQVKTTTAAAIAMLVSNKVNPTQVNDKPFLAFDAKRTGAWLLGQDKDDVSEEVFVLDIASLKHGYILWHQKQANRRMVPLNAPLPEPQEPVHYTLKGKPVTDEPTEARSFEGTLEDGTRFLFEGTSQGARKAIDAVLLELITRAQDGNPFIWPHIQMGSGSYEHPQYGTVFTPALTVVAWYDEDGTKEGSRPKLAPADRPAKPARADDVVDDAEDAPYGEEEEAPQPRRRRRVAG
jgi:hypothetical protein